MMIIWYYYFILFRLPNSVLMAKGKAHVDDDTYILSITDICDS